MAKYKIEFIETKGTDWKIASLTDESGKTEEYHLNRKDKNNNIFSDFDKWMPGHDVEGDPWTNSAGKRYLFPPKPTMQQGAARAGGFSPAKVMAQKAEGIKAAQENKDLGIMTSSTIRMAVDISLSENNSAAMGFDGGVFKDRVLHWREWLISQWDNVKIDPTDKPAF